MTRAQSSYDKNASQRASHKTNIKSYESYGENLTGKKPDLQKIAETLENIQQDSNKLREEHLWQYWRTQDLFCYEEFGLAIVGIGALLWAYGSVTSQYLKAVIGLIGLGASVILWMHIDGAHRECKAVKRQLETHAKKDNFKFFQRFYVAYSWRFNSREKYIWAYLPIRRLQTYFMGLVSWAWIAILIHEYGIRPGTLPIETVAYPTLCLIILAVSFSIIRRLQDWKEWKVKKEDWKVEEARAREKKEEPAEATAKGKDILIDSIILVIAVPFVLSTVIYVLRTIFFR